MQFKLELTQPAVSGSVSLDDAKEFFREDRSLEDSLIESLVSASEKTLQKFTGYYLTDTAFTLHLSHFADIHLPKRPLKSDSVIIKYIDEDSAEQTLASSEYTVYDQNEAVKIEFHGDDLPDLYDESDNKFPVKVEHTIGYGTDHSSVPEDWKTAVKLLALIFWKRDLPKDERSNLNPLKIEVLKSLIDGYKFARFA